MKTRRLFTTGIVTIVLVMGFMVVDGIGTSPGHHLGLHARGSVARELEHSGMRLDGVALHVPNINGESHRDGHEDEIEVAARAPMHVAVPDLMKQCAPGSHVPQAELTG